MTHAEGRAFRQVLIGTAVAVSADFALFVYGSALPSFVDEPAAMEAFMNWCADDGRASALRGERFEAFKTFRYPLMNAGLWLLLTGISTACLAAVLFRTPAPGVSWLRTPASRWAFFPAGLGALIATWAGTIVGIELDQQRFAFPARADSIGIGMAYLTTGTLMVAVILGLAGLLVSLQFEKLPVSLLYWDQIRPARSWIVTLFFGAIILVGAASAIVSSTSADFLTAPAAIASVYLLAASRAALLAPKPAAPSLD